MPSLFWLLHCNGKARDETWFSLRKSTHLIEIIGDPSRTGTVAQIKALDWLTGLKALIPPKRLLTALAHSMLSSAMTAGFRSACRTVRRDRSKAGDMPRR
jgi:hypothetical protein